MACCGKGDKCCQASASSSSNHSNASSSSSSSTPTAVPLPSASKKVPGESNVDPTKPIWYLDNPTPAPQTRRQQLQALMAAEQPLGSKCGVHEDGEERGTCCKELKGEDERHLVAPEIVRDVIIGLSDGLTVPFALTAGLSSLGSSKLVVTGGLAELCAGAISMGLGGFLASQAELDHFHYLQRQTSARVLRSCSGEMEREVHSILGPLGIKEPLSRLVAEDLRSVEEDVWGDRADGAEGTEGVIGATNGGSPQRRQRQTKGSWWKFGRAGENDQEEEGGLRRGSEMGLTAFLLKFGEGLEEVPQSRLWISALTIGMSYFIGGLIPLIPYMATNDAETGLIISCIVTGVILFIFGAFKTYFTGATGGFGGYLYGATSTMIVGGLAAGAAFGLVKVLGVKE
ncbi:VIT family-domain-containing protein [Kockovaella imperatae]|uniref:VIT family-domain-containing protein n=1 Tax=Kockovaella imperatae TaxID=4999 RepID=A0A1Y1UDR2_9TREE|nr:VIT family-domain-containing protein [Kockovaella imperatae]ORX35687.1 VIT family-domain-containing protein [Kockovaella imperatae]